MELTEMMNISTERIKSLDSMTEKIEEMANVLSEMNACIDKHIEETATLKCMLATLEKMLEDLTYEN